MVTIILGLTALTVVLGYKLSEKNKDVALLEERIEWLGIKETENYNYREKKYQQEKENWKQTSSAWMLEKEQHIEKLEQEKFDQLHELALMLNMSYNVDKVILKKAELHDYLLHCSNRRQRREFLEKGYINL